MSKQISRDLIPSESQFLKITYVYTGATHRDNEARRREIREYLTRFITSLLRSGMMIEKTDRYCVEVPMIEKGRESFEEINLFIPAEPIITFRVNGKITEYKLEIDYK